MALGLGRHCERFGLHCGVVKTLREKPIFRWHRVYMISVVRYASKKAEKLCTEFYYCDVDQKGGGGHLRVSVLVAGSESAVC